MLTEEDYKEFQEWWNAIKKKPNSVLPCEKITLPNINGSYIKIPDIYKANFPSSLYRIKQCGALKLYAKTKDGTLEQISDHELYDLNRACKEKKEYFYNTDKWLIEDDNTIIQPNKIITESIKDSSNINESQIINYNNIIIDENLINRIIKHPRYETYIDSKIKQITDNLYSNIIDILKSDTIKELFKNQLLSIPKKLFGIDRVIKRESGLCAWINKLQNREHNDNIYFIPIEVFGCSNFRFNSQHCKDPTKSLKNAKMYAVCQKCHDSVEETDNKFFYSKCRASICAICKNKQTTNKRSSTEIPICVNCCNSSNNGSLDKDWEKVLVKRTFEVVVQQYPDLNIKIYPEKIIPSLENLGQGNHNKRIDILIVFNTISTTAGKNKQSKIAIIIELDDQQKSNKNIEDTMNDIKNTIKQKVQHVYKEIKPDILTIWKVNYNTDFYTPSGIVQGFSFYNRMIILRQYIYVMIYHWHELPNEFVLYFWYDYSKINNITSYWIDDVSEKNFVSFVWNAPHNIDHLWYYCVDPSEGGCEYYERVEQEIDPIEESSISESSQIQIKKIQIANPEKNPYNKIIVNNRKTLKEIFNFDFPYKQKNKFNFSIFK